MHLHLLTPTQTLQAVAVSGTELMVLILNLLAGLLLLYLGQPVVVLR